MPVNYAVEVKNARLQAVIDALGADAVLVIGTAALAGGATGVLATVPFANPSFTIAAGVMTVNNLPRMTMATANGVAAKGELRTSGGAVKVNGLTVGLAGSGADFIVNAINVSVGQTVQVTAGTITHA